jgi:hypothetical protein
MEIIQEIGSYAGFAAVVGLAVLSALYFSQARDVKRLREWAGRAPERSTTPSPAAAYPQKRVVAQPVARPGGPGPVVPSPPGSPATPNAQPQPGTAAAASATGAGPAVATGGPAPATPAAAQAAGTQEESDDERETGNEHETAATDVEESPGTGESAAVASGEDSEPRDGDTSEETVAVPALDPPGEGAPAPADGADDESEQTGEWTPEDEHAEYELTDEHDALPAAKPLPPRPPQPFPRRGGATPASRTGRGSILPPYEQSRPAADPEGDGSGNRKPILLALAAAAGIAVLAFGVLQLTGGDDSPDSGGVAATQSDGGSDSGGPVDPSSVTVAVLNGTTQPGLAAQIGDQIANEGFVRGVVTNNSDQTRAESVVLYAEGAEREAVDVSRRLDIPQREPIDSASQSLAGDATVVVIAGADQIQ